MRAILTRFKIPLIFAAVTFVSIVLAFFISQYEAKSEPLKGAIEIQSSDSSSDERRYHILVDIGGAIQSPGVYEMPADSRLSQLIERAGGFSSEADRVWIEQNLNQAQKMRDGMKIYIPSLVQTVQITSGPVHSAKTVSLNTATASELESLPGIGEKTAGKIIQARPFNSIEELLTRKIVGKSTYEKIKEQVSVW